MEEKKILKLFNEKIKKQEEKLIFIDLLEDLKTFEDWKNQNVKLPFVATHIMEKHWNNLMNSTSQELLDFAWNDKEKIEQIKQYMDNIPNMFLEETFWTADLWNHNTIACIPINKWNRFSTDLQNLINSKKTNIWEIWVNRRLFIKYLIEYDLVLVWKNDLLLFTQDSLNEEEKENFPQSMQIINDAFSELKELVWWEEQFNLWMNLVQKVFKDWILICRYNKKDLEKLLSKLSYSKITYSTETKKLSYMWKEVHKFTSWNQNTKFFDIMYDFPAWIEINFNKLYEIYWINDDYYRNLDNETLNKKLIKFIWKQNELIKKKTNNKKIVLFSQRTEDNKHLVARLF